MLHFKSRIFFLFLSIIPQLSWADPANRPIEIVATTGIIADTTKEIGGDLVAVQALMGEGIDPHLYKPSPGDVRKLLAAEMILFNGLHLEGKMGETLEKLASTKIVRAVAEAIPESKLHKTDSFGGSFDPHVWFNPKLWSYVAQEIARTIIEHKPESKAVIEDNLAKFLTRLDELDSWSEQELSKIPQNQRVLVTAHDAFGYFGEQYKITVKGIQGISTDSEASLKDIESLVNEIVTKKIPAVFVESSVPHKTVTALIEGAKAKGHDLKLGGELFSDALGPDNTPEGTYIGMIRHNVTTIGTALK